MKLSERPGVRHFLETAGSRDRPPARALLKVVWWLNQSGAATSKGASMFDYRDATALITGASSGIGEVFASSLAARAMNLILVARTKPKLEEIARRLTKERHVQATVLEADLADPEAPGRVRARVDELGLSVDLLVNNAGFALSGPFLSHDLTKELEQVSVNVGAVVALTHLFVRDMVARRRWE
jgi:short-subunit dehydrogenase